MADQTPVMMWVTSPTGDVDFINKEYRTFFGVAHEEALHSSWRMPLHDDDSRLSAGALRGAAYPAPLPGRRAHAPIRWGMALDDLARCAAHVAVGRIPRHDRTSQDVTDQRQAATIQQQIARAKDEFIAVLAHELRSPLAPIRTRWASSGAHAAHPLSSGAARSSTGRRRTWPACSTISWTRRAASRATR